MTYKENLDIDPEGYHTHYRYEMIDFIPESSKKILDVGCGSGIFSRELKHKFEAEVWGIEVDSEAAVLAKKIIDKVIVGDAFLSVTQVPDSYFDCIVFNDILEHLADPFTLLQNIKNKLNSNGVIVCSIPNVRHFVTLFDLLVKKQWKYTDQGILDRTHLRFFTKKSLIDMFNSLDYEILKIKGINGLNPWKFVMFNILSFGYLADTRYLQFACVVKPKRI